MPARPAGGEPQGARAMFDMLSEAYTAVMTREQPDPRRNAYREDMAASSLSERVRAPRYVDGVTRQVIANARTGAQRPKFRAAL